MSREEEKTSGTSQAQLGTSIRKINRKASNLDSIKIPYRLIRHYINNNMINPKNASPRLLFERLARTYLRNINILMVTSHFVRRI